VPTVLRRSGNAALCLWLHHVCPYATSEPTKGRGVSMTHRFGNFGSKLGKVRSLGTDIEYCLQRSADLSGEQYERLEEQRSGIK